MFGRHHLKFIYLLAALLLSLQAFAVWHDTAHPFHQAEAQCERLEIIKHTPVVNDLATISVLETVVLQQTLVVPHQHLTVKLRHLPQLIRGPPTSA